MQNGGRYGKSQKRRDAGLRGEKKKERKAPAPALALSHSAAVSHTFTLSLRRSDCCGTEDFFLTFISNTQVDLAM